MILSACVVVPHELARELAAFADAGRDRMRTVNGVRMSADLERLVGELRSLRRAIDNLATADTHHRPHAGQTRPHLAPTRPLGPDGDSLHTVTPAQYAHRHGISVQAVTERCRRGTLPAAKVGGNWQIYATDDHSH